MYQQQVSIINPSYLSPLIEILNPSFTLLTDLMLGDFKLYWWNVSGAKTYEIYRSKYSNKGFVKIATTEEN